MKSWALAAIITLAAVGAGAFKVFHRPSCKELERVCEGARSSGDAFTSFRCKALDFIIPKKERSEKLCEGFLEKIQCRYGNGSVWGRCHQ